MFMKKLSDKCLSRNIKIITSSENIFIEWQMRVPNRCLNIQKYNLRANHYYRELLRASIIPLVINRKRGTPGSYCAHHANIRESLYRAIYVT